MRDDPSVADLVTSARNGDKQAWDGLVERYAPLIWSICHRYRLAGADAEDVGQAVWLHLVEHLDNLRDPYALPGWLATTTRRECCRVLRAPCKLPISGQVLENMLDERTVAAEHPATGAVAAAGGQVQEGFATWAPGCVRATPNRGLYLAQRRWVGSPEPSGLRTSSRVHPERVGCK